jgi:hypothetical protein
MVVKSRRMRSAGQVARIGDRRDPYRVLAEKPKGKMQFEGLRVGGRIILKCIIINVMGYWLG